VADGRLSDRGGIARVELDERQLHVISPWPAREHLENVEPLAGAGADHGHGSGIARIEPGANVALNDPQASGQRRELIRVRRVPGMPVGRHSPK